MYRKKNAVSIRDVAKAAKVSPPTVSNALSGKRYVSPELAKRIRLIAHELGYNPDPRAASLRTGKVNSIALLSPVTFAIPVGRGRFEFLMEVAETTATWALEKHLAPVIMLPTGEPSRRLTCNWMWWRRLPSTCSCRTCPTTSWIEWSRRRNRP